MSTLEKYSDVFISNFQITEEQLFEKIINRHFNDKKTLITQMK